ncbi:MAG TPA: glycosyltransferase 87 family protein [Gaiellaceae bacterium]|nr:glycosyltransferase 87 family protein [Gaiellaceae bacterium]
MLRGAIRAGSLLLFAILPLVVVAFVTQALAGGEIPVEARAYHRAAEAILQGASPYRALSDRELIAGDGYVYPPLTALVLTPLAPLPGWLVAAILDALIVGALFATLGVLGVRDWRCYGLVLLWPPVIQSLLTSNINAFLALAAAAAWRWREAPRVCGTAIGAAFAAKLLLWPLGLWCAVTGRARALSWALTSALLLLAGSFALIRFQDVSRYPPLVRRVGDLMDDRGYNVFPAALDLGAPSQGARLLWLAVASALLLGVVRLARRGDDRRAFVLAIAATLVVSPVLWLHYFVFLVPVAALASPRLGLVWLAPLAMYATNGGMSPPPAQRTATIAVALVVFLAALNGAGRRVARPRAIPSGREASA